VHRRRRWPDAAASAGMVSLALKPIDTPTRASCLNLASEKVLELIVGTSFCRCDRVLWRGKGLKQIRYERCGGYRLSDHRPVRAVFDAVCEVPRPVESFLQGLCAFR
jgi:hypothetical protein